MASHSLRVYVLNRRSHCRRSSAHHRDTTDDNHWPNGASTPTPRQWYEKSRETVAFIFNRMPPSASSASAPCLLATFRFDGHRFTSVSVLSLSLSLYRLFLVLPPVSDRMSVWLIWFVRVWGSATDHHNRGGEETTVSSGGLHLHSDGRHPH